MTIACDPRFCIEHSPRAPPSGAATRSGDLAKVLPHWSVKICYERNSRAKRRACLRLTCLRAAPGGAHLSREPSCPSGAGGSTFVLSELPRLACSCSAQSRRWYRLPFPDRARSSRIADDLGLRLILMREASTSTAIRGSAEAPVRCRKGPSVARDASNRSRCSFPFVDSAEQITRRKAVANQSCIDAGPSQR